MEKGVDKLGYQNILVPIVSFVIGIPAGFLILSVSLMLAKFILRLSFGLIGEATAYFIALAILSFILGACTRYISSYFDWEDKLAIPIVVPLFFWIYSFALIADHNPILAFANSTVFLLLVFALVTIVPFLFVLLFHFKESGMPE